MKGIILDYSINLNKGVIAGNDGNRYTFIGKEWKPIDFPQTGMTVDFVINGNDAVELYIDQYSVKSSTEQSINSFSHGGFYRSYDDQMVAGVCAGIAHKWGVSLSGFRFATFIVSLFFLVPTLIYCFCWMVLPSRSTKN